MGGRRLAHWWAIFRIYLQDGIAYRASGIIWILTDVTTAVTMPVVWSAAAKGGAIAGYTGAGFVGYYLVNLFLNGFITSHIMWDVAVEIKEGQFTTSLMRPVGYWETCFFRSLAWRMIRPVLFLPFFLLFLWIFRADLGGTTLHLTPVAFLSVLGGHVLSFSMSLALAMIALFTEEAIAIFELYYVPLLFLSGTLVPVDVLPEWAARLSRALPFYYTVGGPTEIVLGRVAGGAEWSVIAIQLGMSLGFYALYRVLWTRGTRVYTAVGM